MMSDLIAQGGAGGAGALFGTFLAFIGFKSRLDGQDKRIGKLADSVVYEDTFKSTIEGFEKLLEVQSILAAETREDVRALLKRDS